MQNGDNLSIEGLKVTALPDGKEVKAKTVGINNEDDYIYSLDLRDIPDDKRYLKIEVLTKNYVRY